VTTQPMRGDGPIEEIAEPWRPFAEGHPVRQFATVTFIRGALIAISLTLAAGILSALYSVPSLAPAFQAWGLDLRQLRPLHTFFAAAWVLLAGAAVVHRYLQDHGSPSHGVRLRLRIQVVC